MKPYTILKLDKEYHLRWTLEDMIAYEELTGKLCAEIDFKTQTSLEKLWIMLKKDNAELTLEQTKELVVKYAGEGGIYAVIAAVIEAVTEGQFTKSPNV